MTVKGMSSLKKAEIPPKDLSDEGKCLLAAEEEANAIQTYLNMADNTSDERLKDNFQEVAEDEMEHLGKDLSTAMHIRPELAEYMSKGVDEAEEAGFDIDRAIKDRVAGAEREREEETDFDDHIEDMRIMRSMSKSSSPEAALYMAFVKADRMGLIKVTRGFLNWLIEDSESFVKAKTEKKKKEKYEPTEEEKKLMEKTNAELKDERETSHRSDIFDDRKTYIKNLIEEATRDGLFDSETMNDVIADLRDVGNDGLVELLRRKLDELWKIREYYPEPLSIFPVNFNDLDQTQKNIILDSLLEQMELRATDAKKEALSGLSKDPRKTYLELKRMYDALNLVKFISFIGKRGVDLPIFQQFDQSKKFDDIEGEVRDIIKKVKENVEMKYVQKYLDPNVPSEYSPLLDPTEKEKTEFRDALVAHELSQPYVLDWFNGLSKEHKDFANEVIMSALNGRSSKYGWKAGGRRVKLGPALGPNPKPHSDRTPKVPVDLTNTPIRLPGESEMNRMERDILYKVSNGDLYQMGTKDKRWFGGVNSNPLGIKQTPPMEKIARTIAKYRIMHPNKYGKQMSSDEIKSAIEEAKSGKVKQKDLWAAFQLLLALGYIYGKDDPMHGVDFATLDKEGADEYAKEIEEAVAGTNSGQFWDAIDDSIQYVSSDSANEHPGTGLRGLGRGWVRDAISKIGQMISNGSVLIPTSTDIAKAAVSELKNGHDMTYGRLKAILEDKTAGDALAKMINEFNASDRWFEAERESMLAEVKHILDNGKVNEDSYFEPPLNDSNLRDEAIKLSDALRGRVSAKSYKVPTLDDVIQTVLENIRYNLDRQHIASNVDDVKRALALGTDKPAEDGASTLSKLSALGKVMSAHRLYDDYNIGSTYKELKSGVNSYGEKSRKNEKNIKQLKDMESYLSNPAANPYDKAIDPEYLSREGIEGYLTNDDITKILIDTLSDELNELEKSGYGPTEKKYSDGTSHKTAGEIYRNGKPFRTGELYKKLDMLRGTLTGQSPPSYMNPFSGLVPAKNGSPQEYLKAINDALGMVGMDSPFKDIRETLLKNIRNEIRNRIIDYIYKTNGAIVDEYMGDPYHTGGMNLFGSMYNTLNKDDVKERIKNYDEKGMINHWSNSLMIPIGGVNVPLYKIMGSDLMNNLDDIYNLMTSGVNFDGGDKGILSSIFDRRYQDDQMRDELDKGNQDRVVFVPSKDHLEYSEHPEKINAKDLLSLHDRKGVRDQYPLSYSSGISRLHPFNLRRKKDGVSMMNDFLSSLVFGTKYSVRPLDMIEYRFGDRSLQRVAGVLKKLYNGDELTQDEQRLVKMSNLSKLSGNKAKLEKAYDTFFADPFWENNALIKKYGLSGAIAAVESVLNSEDQDERVKQSLGSLRKTYWRLKGLKDALDELTGIDSILEQEADDMATDFNARRMRAIESGKIDSTKAFGEEDYQTMQDEARALYPENFVDGTVYPIAVNTDNSPWDNINSLDRYGKIEGYADDDGFLIAPSDAREIGRWAQDLYNKMYRSYVLDPYNDEALQAVKSAANSAHGFTDSSMRYTKKGVLRDLSPAEALMKVIYGDEYVPPDMKSNRRWEAETEIPNAHEAVTNLLDAYVRYFTGETKSEPEEEWKVVRDMMGPLNKEEEAVEWDLMANIARNNVDGKEIRVDDDRLKGLAERVAKQLGVKLYVDEDAQPAEENRGPLEIEESSTSPKIEQIGSENKKEMEKTIKEIDRTPLGEEPMKKSSNNLNYVEGAKTRILDPSLDRDHIHTGRPAPMWQPADYVISLQDPDREYIKDDEPWDIDKEIEKRQKK